MSVIVVILILVPSSVLLMCFIVLAKEIFLCCNQENGDDIMRKYYGDNSSTDMSDICFIRATSDENKYFDDQSNDIPSIRREKGSINSDSNSIDPSDESIDLYEQIGYNTFIDGVYISPRSQKILKS